VLGVEREEAATRDLGRGQIVVRPRLGHQPVAVCARLGHRQIAEATAAGHRQIEIVVERGRGAAALWGWKIVEVEAAADQQRPHDHQ